MVKDLSLKICGSLIPFSFAKIWSPRRCRSQPRFSFPNSIKELCLVQARFNLLNNPYIKKTIKLKVLWYSWKSLRFRNRISLVFRFIEFPLRIFFLNLRPPPHLLPLPCVHLCFKITLLSNGSEFHQQFSLGGAPLIIYY